MQNGTTAVEKRTGIRDVMAYFQSPAAMSSLKAACSKHLTPERLLRVAGAAISRQPKLLECSIESLYVAVSNCGQLGLEPNLLGEAYLVPYRNKKTGRTEAQFLPGYRGLVKLARRSGELATIEAHVVHEKDTFTFAYGDQPHIEHVPYSGDDDPGRLTFGYAVAVFKDGSRQRDVMSRREIEAVRTRSMASDSGPWVTDYEEMAKKTVVRRLCKMLPLTVELADALAAEEPAATGTTTATFAVEAPAVEVMAPDTEGETTPAQVREVAGAVGRLKAAAKAAATGKPDWAMADVATCRAEAERIRTEAGVSTDEADAFAQRTYKLGWQILTHNALREICGMGMVQFRASVKGEQADV